MKKFKIFLSREDDFLAAASELREISKIPTDIIYIEDFMNEKLYNAIQAEDLIYFLCNGKLVFNLIKKIKDKNCLIFNYEFLIKNLKKREVQEKIISEGFYAPNIIEFNEINSKKLPIFCKEDSHTGMVFQIYTMDTINSFFKKFDKEKFYFEETILDGNSIKEIKAYYANGNVYPKDGESSIDDKISRLCLELSKALFNINFFSIDLMKKDSNYYVIDINSAPGYYSSSLARKNFIESCINIYEENDDRH